MKTNFIKMLKKVLIGLAVLIIIGGAVAVVWAYPYYMEIKENISSEARGRSVEIPPTVQTLAQVADYLETEKIIADKSSFIQTATRKNYQPAAGKFKIPKEAKNNRDLVLALRGQKRIAEIVLHNIRTKEQLAGVLGRQTSSDSNTYIALFQDSVYLKTLGVKPETVISLFIPNSYEIYWSVDAKGVLERMRKESDKFWTDERLQKAKTLNLNPAEVYTLASIVETESQYNPERPRIAGVYLNRLRQGWKLEADPTVVFAVGDFEIRRVLRSHLETPSPYNTYLNTGLPIGPIYMASINAIDAVLNYEKHEYMFFCAKPDLSGAHNFARTLDAHNANAREYHRWLNNR